MVKKCLAIMLIGVCTLYVSGCLALLAGGAGAAGAAVWLSGKLSKEVNASLEESIEATEQALKSMDLIVTEKTVRSDAAQIMSNYIDGKTIWVDLRPVTPMSTKIDVRVGGVPPYDQEASQAILDRIETNL